MIQKLRLAFALVVFVVVLFACGWITLLGADPNAWWRFIAGPPAPPNVTYVNVFYPSNEVERGLEFETKESSTTIQQFYREELPKHGWVFRCTVVPPPTGAQLAGTDNAKVGSVQPTPTSIPAPSEMVASFVPPPNMNSVWDVYERRGVRWLGHEQTLDVTIGARESFGGTGLTNSAQLREYKFRREQNDWCQVR